MKCQISERKFQIYSDLRLKHLSYQKYSVYAKYLPNDDQMLVYFSTWRAIFRKQMLLKMGNALNDLIYWTVRNTLYTKILASEAQSFIWSMTRHFWDASCQKSEMHQMTSDWPVNFTVKYPVYTEWFTVRPNFSLLWFTANHFRDTIKGVKIVLTLNT